MSDIVPQASFNSGEWSPSLFARVDLQKYHSGAALLQNWFVDYRGGASTRMGTRYVIQTYKTSFTRLINFQAAFNIGYVLELGDKYIRFIYQGSPVVEATKAITGASQASACVLTIVGNSYVIGDWIYVTGVGGMTQLNGRYFNITNVAGSAVTISDLNGVSIDSTAYGAYTSGGTSARIYTIVSPYAAADLELIKFTQATDQMILCHPSYPPYELTLVTPTNWVLAPITFGTTAATPTLLKVVTTLPNWDIFLNSPYGWPGQSFYSYVVTSVDANQQESSPSSPGGVGPICDIRTYPGTNEIIWSPAIGAQSYNVYEASQSYFGVQPPGVQYGFIGSSKGTQFIDDNIVPDFTQGPPIAKNPFIGSGIAFITVTAPGTYTSVPTVTLTGGTPTNAGSAYAVLAVQGSPTISAAGTGFKAGDTINFGNGVVMIVNTVSGGAISSWSVGSAGTITTGSTPTNPVSQVSTTGAGTGATASFTWGVGQVIVSIAGDGYVSAPTVGFSAGAATATATLSSTGNGNPTVCGFFQQRLFLGGSVGAPQSFNMSQPGNYFNFDTHDPSQADDAISGTLVSGTLNTIKSVVPVSAGMLILTDKAAWAVNGGFSWGGVSAAVTPTTLVANAQSFIGANDMPPIVSNWDILFVQSKGSQVRDLTYNIYFNTFTGTDISILASHLFYGYTLTEWAWAEQPFFNVWVIRNDGVMLTLTFLKEQEFVGWTHHVTTNGLFTSVASCTEATNTAGVVDAVYTVVKRVINGNTVRYVERFAERIFPNGPTDAWCVDAGIQYSGSPTTSFQGAEHLAGQTVTGLADGVVIPPFTMPVSGQFTLATAASKVTVGLGYTCDLQTLAIDTGQPSIQGKLKKIPFVDVRVNQTLGLQIGSSFSNLVAMKDLVQGNVSSQLTGQPVQVVNGLYTGDARTFLDPTYTIPGQYCIRQAQPYPATVLGVFPAINVGDDS